MFDIARPEVFDTFRRAADATLYSQNLHWPTQEENRQPRASKRFVVGPFEIIVRLKSAMTVVCDPHPSSISRLSPGGPV